MTLRMRYRIIKNILEGEEMRGLTCFLLVVMVAGCAVEPIMYEPPQLPRYHSGVYRRRPYSYTPPVSMPKEMEDLTYEYAWRDWLTERSTRWAVYEIDLDFTFRKEEAEMESHAESLGIDKVQRGWMKPPLYPPVHTASSWTGYRDWGWRMSPFWPIIKE